MPETFVKKSPSDISARARELNQRSRGIDLHNHMMFEFAIHKNSGRENVFNTYYLPALRSGGFRVIATTVGANSPCMCNMTDYLEFGCFEQIDMLRQEERNGGQLKICTTTAEIEAAVAADKIVVILAFEGARGMEGHPWEESLVMLRTFHALGLRLNCICGGARTAFGDGAGEWRAQAGLTTFGVSLIQEMERLGMIVELTHMTDRGFFDSMEAAQKPVLVSHVGVRKVCDVEANLSDERIRKIGANNGLIGMKIVKTEIKKGSQETGEVVTYDTVVDHIDHIADLIGVRHVCLGLDFDNFPLVHNVFRAMSPAPGSIEVFYTGIPKGDHMLNEPSNVAEAYVIADYLADRGYGDEDILGILGDNAWRFLKETIG